eukprot:gnl/Dysnectes_brevis/8392_a14869_280.p1 GENE.gnl/Dysnectes_brevis/8392_a14869_280~~gnl/Dysnectes_brevis/8392_a14869_280.p1  ORF type:complete len:650 (-),score=54.49 gnl/Dysnectes_brevis/8392_a14869_280:19-1968(-)
MSEYNTDKLRSPDSEPVSVKFETHKFSADVNPSEEAPHGIDPKLQNQAHDQYQDFVTRQFNIETITSLASVCSSLMMACATGQQHIATKTAKVLSKCTPGALKSLQTGERCPNKLRIAATKLFPQKLPPSITVTSPDAVLAAQIAQIISPRASPRFNRFPKKQRQQAMLDALGLEDKTSLVSRILQRIKGEAGVIARAPHCCAEGLCFSSITVLGTLAQDGVHALPALETPEVMSTLTAILAQRDTPATVRLAVSWFLRGYWADWRRIRPNRRISHRYWLFLPRIEFWSPCPERTALVSPDSMMSCGSVYRLCTGLMQCLQALQAGSNQTLSAAVHLLDFINGLFDIPGTTRVKHWLLECLSKSSGRSPQQSIWDEGRPSTPEASFIGREFPTEPQPLREVITSEDLIHCFKQPPLPKPVDQVASCPMVVLARTVMPHAVDITDRKLREYALTLLGHILVNAPTLSVADVAEVGASAARLLSFAGHEAVRASGVCGECWSFLSSRAPLLAQELSRVVPTMILKLTATEDNGEHFCLGQCIGILSSASIPLYPLGAATCASIPLFADMLAESACSHGAENCLYAVSSGTTFTSDSSVSTSIWRYGIAIADVVRSEFPQTPKARDDWVTQLEEAALPLLNLPIWLTAFEKL